MCHGGKVRVTITGIFAIGTHIIAGYSLMSVRHCDGLAGLGDC